MPMLMLVSRAAVSLVSSFRRQQNSVKIPLLLFLDGTEDAPPRLAFRSLLPQTEKLAIDRVFVNPKYKPETRRMNF